MKVKDLIELLKKVNGDFDINFDISKSIMGSWIAGRGSDFDVRNFESINTVGLFCKDFDFVDPKIYGFVYLNKTDRNVFQNSILNYKDLLIKEIEKTQNNNNKDVIIDDLTLELGRVEILITKIDA